jgi:hypothetical protein
MKSVGGTPQGLLCADTVVEVMKSGDATDLKRKWLRGWGFVCTRAGSQSVRE